MMKGDQIIKICGLKDPENIAQVLKTGPDWIGFILHPESPRRVNVDLLSQWMRQHPACFQQIKRIGVFVHQSVSSIVLIAQKLQLQGIQLHGGQSVETVNHLRELLLKTGMEHLLLIKVFGGDPDFDFGDCSPFESLVDYFLFDTKTKLFGGSGQGFEWRLLDKYRGSTPFLIAGGIGPEDASKVARFNHPKYAGVDLNSKFERSPGVKSLTKLHPFILETRKILNHE